MKKIQKNKAATGTHPDVPVGSVAFIKRPHLWAHKKCVVESISTEGLHIVKVFGGNADFHAECMAQDLSIIVPDETVDWAKELNL